MNKKNAVITLFVLGCLGFFSALGYALFKPKENTSHALNVLADITLPVLNNNEKTVALKNLPDDYILINVWGSWCQSCIKEHPFLMSLKNKIRILGVNWYDEPDKANQFLQQKGNPFYQVLVDDEGVFSVAMGIKGAPESFLVKNNTIITQHQGMLTDAIWKEKFAPHLSQSNMVK